MEDYSQEEKQNYLRENILEKGYNTEEFVNFLKFKKGEEGADVSMWSMKDLKEIVQDFINISPPPSKPPSKPEKPKMAPLKNKLLNPNDEEEEENNKQKEEKKPEPKSETVDKSKEKNSQNQNQQNTKEQAPKKKEEKPKEEPKDILASLPEDEFGIVTPKFVACRQSETTDLTKHDKIDIKISDPIKVDKGIFSFAYTAFLITTTPLKLSVRRQHADFVWLRERLSVLFNTNILPRLPKKGKVNGDPHIEKRMRNYTRFLYYLVRDPIIKTSQIFYDFLSVEKDEEFNKLKKAYNKLKTPTEFKDFKSVDGKTRVRVNANKEKIIQNAKDNATFNATYLKKFNQNFKYLKNEMNTVINRMESFEPLFDKLIKISASFIEDNTVTESYKQMKIMFTSWKDILKKQNEFFFTDIKEYLKMLYGNYNHMKELAQFTENQKNNYYKYSKSLISKKVDLFRRGETGSWQLDAADKGKVKEFANDRKVAYKKICFKETNEVIKRKEKYGYYLNRLVSEYTRMRHLNAIENKDKLKQFSKKESAIVTDYFRAMGLIICKMDACIINNGEDNIFKQNIGSTTEFQEDAEKEENQEENNKENEEEENNDENGNENNQNEE